MWGEPVYKFGDRVEVISWDFKEAIVLGYTRTGHFVRIVFESSCSIATKGVTAEEPIRLVKIGHYSLEELLTHSNSEIRKYTIEQMEANNV